LQYVRQAKLATHDTSHHLYPLFPSNDFAALPLEVAAGEQEPEMEPLYEETEGAPTQEQLEEGDPSLVDAELQQGVVYETIGWKDRTKLLMSSVRRLGSACLFTIRK
jgi:hypothetical protein